MANQEQKNYENTKRFLHSRQKSELAKFGYACLELNESLGFCKPDQPWSVNISGDGLWYQSITTLAHDAAVKTHFTLLVATSPKPYFTSDHMRTLQHVHSFLQDLQDQRKQGRNDFEEYENQAKRLIGDLKALIVVTLDLTTKAEADFVASRPAMKVTSLRFVKGWSFAPIRAPLRFLKVWTGIVWHIFFKFIEL
ncbi:hypothetical protein F5050DRAFT_1709976 [Lentinula boryana]|uniref:Uncharacterized protein n=1 Tax=Lentinula boryana TaxID=40481 RepID=A0ABQ8QKQ8_9AGAR|nr:hypothetical protein F5050DRAFT_1709976 [Lentinula boryana]